MDTTSWTAELQQLLKVRIHPWLFRRGRHKGSCVVAAAAVAWQYDISKAAKEDNGVFWMDYDAMLKFFRNVYFNWNPELFEFRKVWCNTASSDPSCDCLPVIVLGRSSMAHGRSQPPGRSWIGITLGITRSIGCL